MIVGNFHGSVDFGGGPVESSVPEDLEEHYASEDIFGAGFDAAGRHLWSRRLASIWSRGPHRYSAAIDPSGHVVVVGHFETVDLGTSTLTSPRPDGFVAKFQPDGVSMWSRYFGISGGNGILDVAIDANGDIVFVGIMGGRMDFGGGILQSFGGCDAFMVKLDPAGGHVWSRRFGAAGLQEANLVALDASGRVSIAGGFSDAIDLGGGALVTEPFQTRIFMATFDAQANHVWSRKLDIGGGFILMDLQSGDGGDAALVTWFTRSIDLGGEVVSGDGAIVARYDPAGAYRWKFYNPRHQGVNYVSFAGESSVVTGQFSGVLDFGGETLASHGLVDGYVARFGVGGGLEYALQVSGDQFVSADECFVGPEDDLWLSGHFSDGVDFGDVEHEGAGAYLAHFVVRPPAPVLVVSLLTRGSAIEIHWNASGEVVLDRFSLLRYHASQSEPIVVASGPIGSGDNIFVDRGVRPGERYQYELVVTMADGTEFRSLLVTATVPTFANELSQNAPNPFNPTTSISYSVSETSYVVIEIYDVAGVHVRNLVEGTRDAGEYVVDWDGLDDAGRAVGSGVYFYRLDGVAGVAPKKMVLLK